MAESRAFSYILAEWDRAAGWVTVYECKKLVEDLDGGNVRVTATQTELGEVQSAENWQPYTVQYVVSDRFGKPTSQIAVAEVEVRHD